MSISLSKDTCLNLAKKCSIVASCKWHVSLYWQQAGTNFFHSHVLGNVWPGTWLPTGSETTVAPEVVLKHVPAVPAPLKVIADVIPSLLPSLLTSQVCSGTICMPVVLNSLKNLWPTTLHSLTIPSCLNTPVQFPFELLCFPSNLSLDVSLFPEHTLICPLLFCAIVIC